MSTTQAQSTGVGRAQNMEDLKDNTGGVHPWHQSIVGEWKQHTPASLQLGSSTSAEIWCSSQGFCNYISN